MTATYVCALPQWRLLLVALFLWLWPRIAVADILISRVINITDGNTITVLDSAYNQRKIRRIGIDAPESEQPFGTVSWQDLAKLVFESK
jgi:endonuclease YncB( thermonuclease family)